MGTRPHPMSVMAKLNATHAVSTITPMPRTSFSSPKSATPATYSSSVSGVVMRLSRLRDHDSSRNPTATAICAWKITWKRRIPARRYATPARPVPPWRATNTPSDPNRIVSTRGHTSTSNQRGGLRRKTYA